MGKPSQDGGFSLIEVLIAVMILGLGFTALLGAMGVAFSGANSFRKAADSGTVAISAAERIKDAAYINCATAASYVTTARAVTLPSGWTAAAVSVDSVLYWNGTAFSAANSCGDASSSYLKLQLVTVSATSPDTRAKEVITVVKRGS